MKGDLGVLEEDTLWHGRSHNCHHLITPEGSQGFFSMMEGPAIQGG